MTKDFTLEDIGKLISESVEASEQRLLKKIDDKFSESIAYTDDRFNWLAKKIIEGFERMEHRMQDMEHGIRKDMREGFSSVNVRISMLEANHGARMSILEEKIP